MTQSIDLKALREKYRDNRDMYLNTVVVDYDELGRLLDRIAGLETMLGARVEEINERDKELKMLRALTGKGDDHG